MEIINLENRDLYVVQFDVDISWYSAFYGNTNIHPALSFSLTERDAENYSDKITLLVQNKGSLPSTVRNNKPTCSVFGNLIFTIMFIVPPKVNNIGKISKKHLSEALKNKNKELDNCDVVAYTPDWNNSGIRYFITPSAYPKLILKHIRFNKTKNINNDIAFVLYNAFNLEVQHINLLAELVNGEGKTFFDNKNNQVNDPYYEKYIKIKTHYLTEIAKKNNNLQDLNLGH